MPKRIQRQRTKGWRMPADTVYVGRGTRWGNQYLALPSGDGWGVHARVKLPSTGERLDFYLEGHLFPTRAEAVVDAVRSYRVMIEAEAADCDMTATEYTAELRGRALACWCPLDQPCHADVLLDLANREES